MHGQNPAADSQSAQQHSQCAATRGCTPSDPKGDKDHDTQLDLEQSPQRPAQQTETFNAEQQVNPPQQETQASVQPSKYMSAPPQLSRLFVGQPEIAVNKEAACAAAAASAEAGAREGRNPLTASRHFAEQQHDLLDPPMLKGTGEWMLHDTAV